MKIAKRYIGGFGHSAAISFIRKMLSEITGLPKILLGKIEVRTLYHISIPVKRGIQ